MKDHALVSDSGEFKLIKSGFYDDDLLCEPCDGYLGGYEAYAFDWLRTLRTASANKMVAFSEEPCDTEAFLRFCAAVIWKHSATRNRFCFIDIGPYHDRLRQIAFGGPIKSFFDVFIARMATGDANVCFYRTPFKARRDGVNFVGFSLGNLRFIRSSTGWFLWGCLMNFGSGGKRGSFFQSVRCMNFMSAQSG